MFLLVLPLSFGSNTFVPTDDDAGLAAGLRQRQPDHATWSATVRGLMLGGPVAGHAGLDAAVDGRAAGRVRTAGAAGLPPARPERQSSSRSGLSGQRRLALEALGPAGPAAAAVEGTSLGVRGREPSAPSSPQRSRRAMPTDVELRSGRRAPRSRARRPRIAAASPMPPTASARSATATPTAARIGQSWSRADRVGESVASAGPPLAAGRRSDGRPSRRLRRRPPRRVRPRAGRRRTRCRRRLARRCSRRAAARSPRTQLRHRGQRVEIARSRSAIGVSSMDRRRCPQHRPGASATSPRRSAQVGQPEGRNSSSSVERAELADQRARLREGVGAPPSRSPS